MQTSDLARGMHQSRGADPSPRRGLRLPRPTSNQSRRSSLFASSPDSILPSDNERNAELDIPQTSSSDSMNENLEGIEVLTMLLGCALILHFKDQFNSERRVLFLSVVTAATGASLMSGTSAPDLSSVPNVVRQDDTPPLVAEASTSSQPTPTVSSQHAGSPGASISAPSRPRQLLRNLRSRLMSRFRDRRSRTNNRPGASIHSSTLASPNADMNTPTSTPIVVDRGSADEAEQLAALRANISQQLTRALARHAADRQTGSSASTPFRTASPTPGLVDPTRVPLPPDESMSIYERPSSPVAGVLRTPAAPRRPMSPDASLDSASPFPHNTEQSFEAFLSEIQLDLRTTLMRRQEQERRLREQREHRDYPRSSGATSVQSQPTTPATAPLSEEGERVRPDLSSFTLPPNYHLTEHVPSVSVVPL